MKNKRALVIGGIILAVVLVAFLIGYFFMRNAVNKVGKGIIRNNVYVGEVDLSGMTKAEAKEALLAQVAEYHKEKVELSAEGTTKEMNLGDLGFEIANLDKLVNEAVSYAKTGSVFSCYRKMKALEESPKIYRATYRVNEEIIKTAMAEKMPELQNGAVNATIRRENGAFIVTDSAVGKKIDVEKSVEALNDFFNNEWRSQIKGTVSLVTILDEPTITREQLEQIQSALGTFSTTFTRNNNRGKNIAHATGKINGAILMPGEEYSASNGMGSRNAANGYLEAGSYLDGQTVQSYGGGVCQVSTTLYNAVLLAELEITERWSHSMTVDYVKPSMDAAIAEGSKDFKFKNNTGAPIYIEGYTVGGKLTFTIYGTETRGANRKVSYVSEVTSRTAAKKKFVASGDAVGVLKKSVSGHDAIKAKLWKVVTENGVQVSKTEVNTSSYQSSKATWKVGTGTTNQEALQVLKSAISSQNETTIQNAIAQAQSIISAAQQPATPPAEGQNTGTP